jgi:hypothetical protein
MRVIQALDLFSTHVCNAASMPCQRARKNGQGLHARSWLLVQEAPSFVLPEDLLRAEEVGCIVKRRCHYSRISDSFMSTSGTRRSIVDISTYRLNALNCDRLHGREDIALNPIQMVS